MAYSRNNSLGFFTPDSDSPYLMIVEQPSQMFRFRYASEGRNAGSLYGVNSTPDNKTYPAIRLLNYSGPVQVVISCVTKDLPYRPHPHGIMNKTSCPGGVCVMRFDANSNQMVFKNLGIQCSKRNEVSEALRLRELNQIDPFQTLAGFAHRDDPTSIDLQSVRLCFQAYLEEPGMEHFIVPPVLSDPIITEKAFLPMCIVEMSHFNAPCNGGQKIILVCKKFLKTDIEVCFFDNYNWEALGLFSEINTYSCCTISLRTPAYKDINISQPVKVKIKLRRPSSGECSEPVDFEFLPLIGGKTEINLKRRKGPLNSDFVAELERDFGNFHATPKGKAQHDLSSRQKASPSKILSFNPCNLPQTSFDAICNDVDILTPTPLPEPLQPTPFAPLPNREASQVFLRGNSLPPMPFKQLPQSSNLISPIFKGTSNIQNLFNTNNLETTSVAHQEPPKIPGQSTIEDRQSNNLLNSDEIQNLILDISMENNMDTDSETLLNKPDSKQEQK